MDFGALLYEGDKKERIVQYVFTKESIVYISSLLTTMIK